MWAGLEQEQIPRWHGSVFRNAALHLPWLQRRCFACDVMLSCLRFPRPSPWSGLRFSCLQHLSPEFVPGQLSFFPWHSAQGSLPMVKQSKWGLNFAPALDFPSFLPEYLACLYNFSFTCYSERIRATWGQRVCLVHPWIPRAQACVWPTDSNTYVVNWPKGKLKWRITISQGKWKHSKFSGTCSSQTWVLDTFVIFLPRLHSKGWLGVPSFFIMRDDLVVMANVTPALSHLIVTVTNGKGTLTFPFDSWGNWGWGTFGDLPEDAHAFRGGAGIQAEL